MNSPQSDRQIPKHLDKTMFAFAGVYFLLALMWGFYHLSEEEPPETVASNLDPNDAQFIAYLQQSLNVINQPPTPKTLINPKDKNPSTVAIQPPAPPPPEKVIERIYVPMYPPNQSTSTPTSISPSLEPPSLPSQPSGVVPPTPRQNTIPVPPEIATNNQLPSNNSHQLVGVLESGQQSTAIFTFNGISRRFEIGEAVGSSGGILMGVQNQKAIIYHNGQTKYVEVGQAF
ncbi:hypothetical protein [Crocosphaera sp. Alani8]|uniref:hypothetical protein n=1 Tax=Crocosphaera sp. Alani8 TaxID=3038952 RepID=UPI00313E5B5B